MTDRSLWEILVPATENNGRLISIDFHRIWDEKVRLISGGLTILPPAKGQWIDHSGNIFKERMIPVRILANRNEMDKIVDMTITYYNQLAVFAYKISDEYILKHYRECDSDRKAFFVEELSDEWIDQIENSKMDEKYDHLNDELLDD